MAYASRSLTAAERNYGITELESRLGTRSLPQLPRSHRVHGPLSRPPYAQSKWEARSMVD